MKDPIEILCSANVNYARLLMVTIKSLLNHAESPERIRFHIINRDMPDHFCDFLESYVDAAGATLRMIDYSEESLKQLPDVPADFFKLPDTGHYDRLLAPYLIEGSKALYLDCDILVQADLAPLWESALSGHPIAAVQDSIIPMINSDFGVIDWKDKGLKKESPYFNSGILLMDLDRWRDQKICAACISCALDFIEKFEGPPPLHDQYALNVVAYRDWESLPLTWNSFSEKVREAPDSVAIVHFAGEHKPFHKSSSVPGPSKYFIRKALDLIKEDVDIANRSAGELLRLEAHHEHLDSGHASLRTPNNRPVSFAPAAALSVEPDVGSIAMVMPIMIKDVDSLRFRNFTFLLRTYAQAPLIVIVVEQVLAGDASPLADFLSGLDSPNVHHVMFETDDTRIHKTALINQGARLAFDTLDARYVWQVDGDIFVHPGAVIQQLSALNSTSVGVIRPLLYFIRMEEIASEQLAQSSVSEIALFDPEEIRASPYQIIDLFGPGTLIFSREAFDATGGMDEAYVGWGWEDMEFAERLEAFQAPHALPLIGAHLHHEEDRIPHMENFDRFCNFHLEEVSAADRRHTFVHTVYHNFLSKFAVIEFGTSQEVANALESLASIPDVDVHDNPVLTKFQPEEPRFAPNLVTQMIYSMGSCESRATGFHLDLSEPLLNPINSQTIRLEELIDFMISTGFQIAIVEPEKRPPNWSVFKNTIRLIESACEFHQRDSESVLHLTALKEKDHETLTSLWVQHFEIPGEH